MRIWDVPPSLLCRQHLLGEHRELHGLWRILTENRQGYAITPKHAAGAATCGALSAARGAD